MNSYFVFETAAGFCGIAWNTTGITRFQLPARTVQATERNLLRRLPTAEPGIPTPEVAEAIAAAQRYFDGEQIDFSHFQLDLAGQDAFLEKVYNERLAELEEDDDDSDWDPIEDVLEDGRGNFLGAFSPDHFHSRTSYD